MNQGSCALRSAGIDMDDYHGQPVIGIANTWGEINNCNMRLRAIAEEVKKEIRKAGGIALGFPVITLGEELMKPPAGLYRNLLSMDVEENLRAYPKRKAAWKPPVSMHTRGYPKLYIREVLQADEGCDLDFLKPKTSEDLVFVQPIVGRS